MSALKLALQLGSVVTQPRGPAILTDPHWANVVFLAGFDTSATLDESATPRAMTATAPLSSTSKFGAKSLAFDNSTNKYARLTTELTLSQQFTIEGWAYTLDTGDQYIFSGISGNMQVLRLNQTGAGQVSCYLEGQALSSATGLFNTATWNHFAVCRDTTTVRFFVNGVSVISAASSGTVRVGAIGAFFLSDAFYPGYDFNGYIDEVRITNSVARYTANFTPPTTAFLRA